jgi:AcrR family transcriptional regulator
LYLFGRNGFEGTSTRQLAARANTNIASISYHFGSKAGLREACARSVVERVTQALDEVLDAPGSGQAAIVQIERLVGTLVNLMVGSPDTADMVTFMLREVAEPGEIADDVYRNFIEPRHKAICGLWALATGRDPEDPVVKLAIFALVGQVLYFRIATPFVTRRMSWSEIGPNETRQISETVIDNLRSTIERQKL